MVRVKLFKITLILDPTEDDKVKLEYELDDRNIVGRVLASARPISEWTQAKVEETVAADLEKKIDLVNLLEELTSQYKGQEIEITLPDPSS